MDYPRLCRKYQSLMISWRPQTQSGTATDGQLNLIDRSLLSLWEHGRTRIILLTTQMYTLIN